MDSDVLREDRKWQAALMDGEGSISLGKAYSKSWYNSRPCRRGFTWSTRTHIFNNNRFLLEHAQKLYGGNIIPIRPPSKKARNQKEAWDLLFNMAESERMLEEVTPYLIAKKQHAELFLEARELLRLYRGLGPIEELTDIRDKRMEAIYWELRILNARGRDGAEKVMEELNRLPEDPRFYHRDNVERDVAQARLAISKRKKESHLKSSREWKARNRDKMKTYWSKWYREKRAERPSGVADLRSFGGGVVEAKADPED